MNTVVSAHRLCILGAGVMGAGIATLATMHGLPVDLVDPDADRLTKARAVVANHHRHAQLAGALPAAVQTAELRTCGEPDNGVGYSAVVEAVTERDDMKQSALQRISDLVPPGTPLISNTSGIPIDELAGHVRDPADLVGIHFMNPPYLIRMVEVIRGPRTSDRTMNQVDALLSALDRRSVVVHDAPGFVTSRLLHPMINSAARLVGAEVATAEGVDALMEGCLGHPSGPLRTADLIGLDNLVDSLDALYRRLGDESCRPCEVLLAKVRAGDLGRKTGRGFYDYGEALA